MTSNIGEMDVEEVATGRYITDIDNDHRDMVCMIGADVADKLYPNTDPLGKILTVDGQEFQMVGVAKKHRQNLRPVAGQLCLHPDPDLAEDLRPQLHLSVNVQARGPEWLARTKEEARMLMRARRHLAPNDEDNFGILASDNLMGLWKNLTGTLASGMVGLVSIFLIIGGVVIMNVMLASVTERTREIGIRKSLGAKRRDILLQFLVESTVMALVGGAIGVLIAWLLAVDGT